MLNCRSIALFLFLLLSHIDAHARTYANTITIVLCIVTVMEMSQHLICCSNGGSDISVRTKAAKNEFICRWCAVDAIEPTYYHTWYTNTTCASHTRTNSLHFEFIKKIKDASIICYSVQIYFLSSLWKEWDFFSSFLYALWKWRSHIWREWRADSRIEMKNGK